MEGHQAFTVGRRMYLIEAGFEVSYLDIGTYAQLLSVHVFLSLLT
jgi:hypothetical protein